ncbi:MAG: NOP58 family protein [Candidatus Micrarchaeota archaeon]|nr:NOP58 family protein [Candidatus Micrarchaeota archaeon]MDE1834765.1 NOP58 family protein [Candidatus Micrarchaeota archaeon]MDE1858897.1 NOP58 family protein [Candidatus Micrarchaeota archaeon]
MKESPEAKRARLLGLAKASVTGAYASGEHAISQAIASYNELDKMRNLVNEKLEEWYGIHFPELRLANQLTYAKFVLQFGANKKEASEEQLAGLLGNAASAVHKQAEQSMGQEPTEEEYAALKDLAQLELDIAEKMERLDKYLEKSTKAIMPNITYLIDYKIAAELLARAGSLNKLAYMPAGTLQLLGAEKALFKHLKFGSKPPKYGSLFKLPQVNTAGRFERGRIARVYATKLAIAARADGISKNFIAPQLKEQLDKAIAAQAKHKHREDTYQQERRSDQRGRFQFRKGNRQQQRNRDWKRR